MTDDDDFLEEKICEMENDSFKEETHHTDKKLHEEDELMDFLLVTGELDDYERKPKANKGCLGSVALMCLVLFGLIFSSK